METNAYSYVNVGIFRNSLCGIHNLVVKGTFKYYSSSAFEISGLVNTLTTSLSHVTIALNIGKNVGMSKAFGHIATYAKSSEKIEIQYVVLSGTYSATGGGTYVNYPVGGIVGAVKGTDGANIEISIHNIMVLGHQIFVSG